MNDELRELYQDVIIEHSKRPRNFRPLDQSARKAEGSNPLCGDTVTVYVKMDADVIREVAFEGSGCAISTASASVMTEAVKGKTRAEAEALFHTFHDLVRGNPDAIEQAAALGKLAVFGGVSEFPVRVKCAVLCWHTLNAALEGREDPVTME